MNSFSAPPLDLGWNWSLVEGSFLHDIPIEVIFVISDGSVVDPDGVVVHTVPLLKHSRSWTFLLLLLLFLPRCLRVSVLPTLSTIFHVILHPSIGFLLLVNSTIKKSFRNILRLGGSEAIWLGTRFLQHLLLLMIVLLDESFSGIIVSGLQCWVDLCSM